MVVPVSVTVCLDGRTVGRSVGRSVKEVQLGSVSPGKGTSASDPHSGRQPLVLGSLQVIGWRLLLTWRVVVKRAAGTTSTSVCAV